MSSGSEGEATGLAVRTAMLGAVLVAVTCLSLGLLSPAFSFDRYHFANQVAIEERVALIERMLLGAGATGLALLVAGLRNRRRAPDVVERLARLVRGLSPLAPLSCVPLMLRWSLWVGHPLIFLVLTLVVACGAKWATTAACAARPLELLTAREGTAPRWDGWFGRIPVGFWLVVATLATLAYVVYFSYYTVIWHLSARSGWDLAIEDNVLWNILHGGPFFKASPETGPAGSHFSRHAALIAYLLVPFYALHQSAETVLVLQALFVGASAIPLYLLGAKRLGAPLAALIAIVYLMNPALQEGNLYEMHYTKLGTLPFWMTLWLLDNKKHGWALLAAALTLLVREDVATWILLLGAVGLATGLQTRTNLLLMAMSAGYVMVIKFWLMPSFSHGNDELIFIYQGLLPQGKGSFAWAILTALTNPALLLTHLLTEPKLLFLLQIFVPLLFVPIWRPLGWIALVPGFVFCFLSTGYAPLFDIHFQYATHLLALLFPALVWVLGEELKASRARGLGTVAGVVVATLLCSSQYGSVIQRNTSQGGPMLYRFGWDDEGRARHDAIEKLKALLPPDAAVAATAMAITQVSARANAYPISFGFWNADWAIATSRRFEMMREEREKILPLLESGQFGVVMVRGPFFVMRRGYDTAKNAVLLAELR